MTMVRLRTCLKAINASWHPDPWIGTLEIEGKIIVERQRDEVFIRPPAPTKTQPCKRRVDVLRAVRVDDNALKYGVDIPGTRIGLNCIITSAGAACKGDWVVYESGFSRAWTDANFNLYFQLGPTC